MKKIKYKPLLVGTVKSGKTFAANIMAIKRYYGIKWLFFSKAKKTQIIYKLMGI